VIVAIPIKLPSATNLREHWRVRAKRIKEQRRVVSVVFKDWGVKRQLLETFAIHARGGVLEVTLTRISPRKLDSDNLQGAFKGIRDEVAAVFGVDDGSDQWVWTYRQESGPACIRIEVRAAAALAQVTT
jgi:hypothetical protein